MLMFNSVAKLGQTLGGILIAILALAMLLVLLGVEPKPCPPHICVPDDIMEGGLPRDMGAVDEPNTTEAD